MRAGTKGWLALLGVIVGTNTACKDGDTMSEVADKWMARCPWLVRAVGALIFLHVTNSIPPSIDVIHGAHLGIRAARRKLLT
ncbi:MAG: hypothetical protein K0U84_18475 [Actinomycetia bacterium]|nr:hypothetical protein [Actinomycetes bacterium]